MYVGQIKEWNYLREIELQSIAGPIAADYTFDHLGIIVNKNALQENTSTSKMMLLFHLNLSSA